MTLKARFTTSVGLLLAASCVSIAAANWYLDGDGAREQLVAQAETVAGVTADVLSKSVVTKDFDEVRRVTDGIRGQPGVLSLLVLDAAGKSVSHGASQSSDDEALVVERPMVHDDEVVGTVRVGYSTAALRAQLADTRNRTLGLGLLFVGAGLAWITILLGSVLRPLDRLVRGVRRVAAGDFTAAVEPERDDDLGVLAHSFNGMTLRLRRITVSRDYLDTVLRSIVDSMLVVDAQGRVERLNAPAAELIGLDAGEIVGRPVQEFFAEDSDETLLRPLATVGIIEGVNVGLMPVDGVALPVTVSGASRLSSEGKAAGFVLIARDVRHRKRTQDALGALVGEVSLSAERAERRARQIRDAVAGTASVGDEGRAEVERAVESMRSVSDHLTRTTRGLEQLSDRATGIGDAAHKLNALAKRTSLLALNAAIQAAQAGAEGKGFATVASEIGELADESREYTQEINGLLGDIADRVGSAVASNGEVKEALEEASAVSSNAREAIEALAHALDQAGSATSEIASYANQPAEGLHRIREALSTL